MHSTIAMTKKCCYCCDLLGQILNSGRGTDHQFKLPGAHGMIFPWIPPADLDATVLSRIKDILVEEVRKEVRKGRASIQLSSRSRQSTSASSDSDLEPQPEHDHKARGESMRARIGWW